MQAITYRQYGCPEVVQLTEIAPPVPTPNEVRIRVHAAAVTSADAAFRKGDPLMARLAAGLWRPQYLVLGTEFSGVIDAVGDAVSQWRTGDAVYAASGTNFGAHAEFVCLPEDGALARKPEGVSHAEAAAICESSLTALPFLRDGGRIRPDDQVLINGASGSVGTAAVQLAKHFGAEVTGVCSAANQQLVRSLGADHVIDYGSEDFTTNGRTYDIILDAVAKSSFGRCQRSLKPKGRYLTTVPTLAVLLQMLWTSRRRGKRAIVALTGLRSAADKARDLNYVRSLVKSGAFRAVIDETYPFARASAAHRLVDSGHKRGSAVITLATPSASRYAPGRLPTN